MEKNINNLNKNNMTQLNSNQDKKLLSIKIEKYFTKSNLNSLEKTNEKKIKEIKELLFNFHILYNSFNKMISIQNNKKKEHIQKYSVSNSIQNSYQQLYFIVKKSKDNRQSIENSKNLNLFNDNKMEEKKNFKNIQKIKAIKSFTSDINNNKIIKDNINDANAGYLIKEKMKSKKANVKIINLDYRHNLKNSNKRRTVVDRNSYTKSSDIFNENKMKTLGKKKFNYQNNNENTKINISNINTNNKYKKSLSYFGSPTENNNKSNNHSSTSKIKTTCYKTINKNKYKEISTERSLNSINKISKINLTIDNKNNFYKDNDFVTSRFTIKEEKNKIYNNNKTIANLNNSKEEEIFHRISINKNYKFEQRLTFKNKQKKNINIINNRIYDKERLNDFHLKMNSDILFTKEKRTRQLKKNNIFFMFFTQNKNYNILQKIYNFLYINEDVKKGKNNYLKNIFGPFRDIYLNKCLSLIEKQKDKSDNKKNKKPDDIWSIMEKEILEHKRNKIKKYIENNKKIEI